MRPGGIIITNMVCLAVSIAAGVPDHSTRRSSNRYSIPLLPDEGKNHQTPMYKWSMITANSRENDELIEPPNSMRGSISDTRETRYWTERKLPGDRKGYHEKGKSGKALFNRLQPLDLEETLNDNNEDDGPSSLEIYRLDLVEDTPLLANMNMYIPNGGSKPTESSRLDWNGVPRMEARRQEEHMRGNLANTGKVPELQVGCEGFADITASVSNEATARAKRFLSDSVEKSISDSNYTVRIIPQEDEDYEYDYEEMDELVRLKKLFGSAQTPKRGDIQSKIDPYSSPVHQDPPNRGDLGSSTIRTTNLTTSNFQDSSVSEIHGRTHRNEMTHSTISSLGSYEENFDLPVKVPPNELPSNFSQKSADRWKRSIVWGYGENEGNVGDHSADGKKLEEHKRRQEYKYEKRENDEQGGNRYKLEIPNEHLHAAIPHQRRLDEKTDARIKDIREIRDENIPRGERTLENERKFMDYVNRNRPVRLREMENHRRVNHERKSDTWRNERAYHARQQEERKLQEYIKNNEPIKIPRDINSGFLRDGNVQEMRRTAGTIRYPAIRPDRREHGPSAPNIDQYSHYSPRYDAPSRGTTEERRRQDYEARQAQERQRYIEEERRREEEYRRQQSRRYEENRRRQEAERTEAERRTRPSESAALIGRPSAGETNRQIADDSRRRMDETWRNSQAERRAEGDRRWTGHVTAQSWRERENARLNSLPVSARIIVQPPRRNGRPSTPTVTSRINDGFENEINFSGINPARPGVKAPRFPAAVTSRPPVASPGPCVWAIVQCCPSNRDRLVTCFELLGCLGANWTPDPCSGAIARAAQMEITKFYEDSDAASRYR